MKKLISLVLVVVFLLSPTGCNQDTDNSEQNTDSIEQKSNAVSNQWGITLKTENETSTGLTIVCYHSGGKNVFELTTGSYFVIQKFENEVWGDVPPKHDVVWDTVAWIIQKEGSTTWDVNWEFLYDELPAGQYRIGKEIMNFRGTGDYDKETVYAEFSIE